MTRYLAAAIVALALVASLGWYVSSLRVEIARLETALAGQRATYEAERATREGQARRAIDTARRQEQEDRDAVEAARRAMERDRARVAGDLADALRRLRSVARPASGPAADGGGVPATAAGASGGDGADPIGLLVAHGERLYRIAAEADAAAVRARLGQQWIGAVAP